MLKDYGEVRIICYGVLVGRIMVIGYLFANSRGNRMKLLLHDGFGMWCAARRLNQGGFEWPRGGADMATSITLTKQQFDALVLGLPWSRLEQMQSITRV